MFGGSHEKDEVSSKDLSSSSADGNSGSNRKGETSLREDVARFVRKLFSFVDDPSCDDIVSWNETGTGFVIWDSNAFCTKVLSCFFRHTNLSSFVRQLNQYGFRKTAHSRWEFCHESFRRGRPELLGEIKRVSVSSSASGKSSKPLLQTKVPPFVDFAPYFGLPFAYSAADLKMELMDGSEARLVALQEEAKFLMRKIEESKSQFDELKLYVDYGSVGTEGYTSAAKKKTSDEQLEMNSLGGGDLTAVAAPQLAPKEEQLVWNPRRSATVVSPQTVDQVFPRQEAAVDPTRFTSELVYRRWVKAQLEREAELKKLETEREWNQG